jgi:hypothetical protein
MLYNRERVVSISFSLGVGQNLYCLYLFSFYEDEKASLATAANITIICLPV